MVGSAAGDTTGLLIALGINTHELKLLYLSRNSYKAESYTVQLMRAVYTRGYRVTACSHPYGTLRCLLFSASSSSRSRCACCLDFNLRVPGGSGVSDRYKHFGGGDQMSESHLSVAYPVQGPLLHIPYCEGLPPFTYAVRGLRLIHRHSAELVRCRTGTVEQ